MFRESTGENLRTKQDEFTEQFREQGREQVDQLNRESGEKAIEKKVKAQVIEELRKSLKEKNTITLDNCKGDITGIVEQLENGEKVTYNLFEGASEGSEEKMTRGLFDLVTNTFNLLKPLENIDALFNALGASQDDEIDTNIEAYYETYSKTPEGKRRIEEVRLEVESEFKEE